ncbi:MAG TPA: aminopeptidase P family N-terminal domain-containing protein, partial [Actinomycetota bacterium]|nr:aminopeptidase P family N-terminal domain-containing protein [Actinomycetota bacterium]
MDYEGRIARLRDALAGAEVDALLVTNLTNVRYLCGFSGTNGQLLVTSSGATFFTDPRYRARAGDLVQGAEIEVYDVNLHDSLKPRLGGERTGIEAATMTVATKAQLEGKLEVELTPTKNLVENLRRTKDAEEVSRL